MWPQKSKMERKMLHQVGRPLENVSNVAKQIVGLARAKRPAFDGVGVKYFAFDIMTNADLLAILRASCSEQNKSFF